ncbi:MAG: hypothetical protein ABIF01_02635 [Candidatus Micrarchaeota archaeon]
MREVERAFAETTKLLLGTELEGLDDYGGWLSRRVPIPVKEKSALSGREVWMQPPLCLLRKPFDKSRIIDIAEIEKVNKSPFKADDLKDADLHKLLDIVKPVTYYCGNLRYQTFNNLEKVSGAGGVSNIYCSEDIWFKSKSVAFSNLVVFSDNIFGSHMAHYSHYCINIYNSFKISRGFEIDGCTNCSDVYFCHNSQNLRDCILCFNAKNLKYAVGNTELKREKYLELKAMLFDYITENLAREKALEVDIFNVGCYGES